jgi:elongation factor G
MCFINKMDRTGADFYFCLDTIKGPSRCTTAVVQLPIGSESNYKGVVDLLKMKAVVWSGEELGADFDEVDIPEDMVEQAELYRSELIDTLSTFDENILEKFVGEEPITAEDLRRALRYGTIENLCVPILNGTAFKNKGVQPLLDAVIDYMPSPVDLPPVLGETPKGQPAERKPSDNEPFAALAFKIMSDPHVGRLTYFRVYSGTLDKGDQVLNARTGKKERLGRLLEMHANAREDVDRVYAGDIVAAIGMKDTKTGDTLCDDKQPIILEKMVFPEPVIHVAIEPKTKVDQDKMAKALGALSDEDPTFRVHTDEETGQTIMGGMGELHLEVLVDRMLREFKVDANIGKPQVAYRETITQAVKNITYTHKKQTGGSGQYAEVTIDVEPLTPGEGEASYEFVDKITGGRIPRRVHPGRQRRRPRGDHDGCPRGLSGRKRACDPHRWQVPRRRLVRAGVQDRRHPGHERGYAQGEAVPARADHGRSSRHTRRLHGRSHGRPLAPPGQARWSRSAWQQQGDHGPRPVVRDVRLRYRPAFADPGPCDVHDAVRLVSADASIRTRSDRRPRPRRVTVSD